MDDQPHAQHRARPADARRRHAARRGRLDRRADRGRRGRSDPGGARRARRPRCARAAAGRRRGRMRRRARGHPAWHLALPVAVPGPARPARQRDDPRESADARARALRGFGVLRQADARAARGLEPAALARHAHLRPRPERDIAGELRHPARTLFAVGRRRAGARGAARIRRRGALLGRRLSPLSLAIAGDAHAALPGDAARARGPRQGGQAVRRRADVPAALPRYLSQALPRGPQPHDPARHLGFRCSASSRPQRCTAPTPGSRSRPSPRASRSAR